MNRTTVALIRGAAAHGNVNRLIDGLGRGFAACGTGTLDVDPADRRSLAALQNGLASGAVDLVVAMNVGLDALHLNRAWLNEAALFLYMLDHPAVVAPALNRLVPAMTSPVASFPTETQVGFARHVLPADLTVRWLPHAADLRPVRPWDRKDIPLLFVGNAGDGRLPEAIRDGWRRHGQRLADTLNRVADACLADPVTSPDVAALRVLAAQGEIHPVELCLTIAEVDRYVRERLRHQALQRLADVEGLHVFGAGWQALAANNGKACWHGPVDAGALPALLDRARIVLNLVPAYYDSHERLFDAAAAGAVPMTPATAFAEHIFGSAAVTFTSVETIAETAQSAIADPEDMASRGENARAVVAGEHTWAQRARTILDWMADRGAVRTDGGAPSG